MKKLNTTISGSFVTAPSLQRGDKVAVIACSSGAAAHFPWICQRGLSRLEKQFGLKPVAYPTLREKNPSVRARADDLNRAFSDKEIKGIVTSIGGTDMIRVLPFLSEGLVRENPKRVFGYSDITSLHLFMYKCGIVSYYGGNLLTQFGISGENMQGFTVASLEHGLGLDFDADVDFGSELPVLKDVNVGRNKVVQLSASSYFTDGYHEWSDKDLQKEPPKEEPNTDGWIWEDWSGVEALNMNKSVNTKKQTKLVSGRLWGGCLSTLYPHLVAQRYIVPFDEMQDAVLFLETSETMPNSYTVYSFLASLGEIGLLQRFSAILVGRPQTLDRGIEPPIGRDKYKLQQREAYARAISEYCHGTNFPVVVYNMDFGHTNPQIIVPSGGMCHINTEKKTIEFDYS